MNTKDEGKGTTKQEEDLVVAEPIEEMSTDISTINTEEVAYMLILNADLSARTRKRSSATVLKHASDLQDEPKEELVRKVMELRQLIGQDTPIFPAPHIVGPPSPAHQLFQECYEIAHGQALVEMGQGEIK